MGKDIRINISADAKMDAIRSFNREIAKMVSEVKWANDDMRNALLRSARDFDPINAAADKVGGHVMLTAKQIESAWRKYWDSIKQEPKKVAEEVQKSMDNMEKATNSGSSRISQIFKGALKGIGGAFSQFGTMLMQGGVWGAMGALATKAVGAVFDYFKERAEKAAKLAEEAFKHSLENIEAQTQTCANSFDKSISSIDRASRKYADAADSVRDLTKAQIELAKQMAIANGMSEKDAELAASDLTKDVEQEVERKKISDRIEADEKKRQEAIDAYKRTKHTIKRAKRVVWDAEYELSIANPEDEEDYKKKEENVKSARKALHTAVSKQKQYDQVILDTGDDIESARKALESLETFREARAIEAQNKISAEVSSEIEAEKKAKETAAKKEADARIAEEKRVAAERQKAEEKAAAERARLDAQEQMRRERERQAEFAERIKEHQKMLAEERSAESAAKAQQSAAESKLQQAWGWYRNKDSLRAQLEEEKSDAAARKQFEKDFERLKFRRDWRKAENLSVDDEAVRRVALAREEKEAAERHLAEIEKNTADLAAKIDELLQVKG